MKKENTGFIGTSMKDLLTTTTSYQRSFGNEAEDKNTLSTSGAALKAISIQINHLLPSYREIVKDLLTEGIRINNTFGSTSIGTPSHFVLSIGEGVPLYLIQKIVAILSRYGLEGIALAMKTEKKMHSGRIYIGAYGYDEVGTFLALKDETLSMILSKEISYDALINMLPSKMNEAERNSWYQSLGAKLAIFSAIAGIVLGAISIPLFGPIGRGGPADWGIIHLFVSALGPFTFALLVYHNIWFRQLSLPGALVGAIYSAVKVRGSDLYVCLYLSILAIVIRNVIGLVEARATTGRYADFWRSFIFHPLNWAKEFGIKTLLE